MHVALAVFSLSFTLPEVTFLGLWFAHHEGSAGQGVGRVEAGEEDLQTLLGYFLNFPTTAAETSLSRALFLLFSVFLLLITIKTCIPLPSTDQAVLSFSLSLTKFYTVLFQTRGSNLLFF